MGFKSLLCRVKLYFSFPIAIEFSSARMMIVSLIWITDSELIAFQEFVNHWDTYGFGAGYYLETAIDSNTCHECISHLLHLMGRTA
jgi:hypothetical protein